MIAPRWCRLARSSRQRGIRRGVAPIDDVCCWVCSPRPAQLHSQRRKPRLRSVSRRRKRPMQASSSARAANGSPGACRISPRRRRNSAWKPISTNTRRSRKPGPRLREEEGRLQDRAGRLLALQHHDHLDPAHLAVDDGERRRSYRVPSEHRNVEGDAAPDPGRHHLPGVLGLWNWPARPALTSRAAARQFVKSGCLDFVGRTQHSRLRCSARGGPPRRVGYLPPNGVASSS
jgi:hypothetical protein